jgi:hypothetical protein
MATDEPQFAQRGTAARLPEIAARAVGWLVASEHFYNRSNIGLNMHSDMLCEIGAAKK